MNYHEFTAFEEQINITLFNDIVSFISDTATASGARALRQNCLFLTYDDPDVTFQEKYGFLYLGELLERYEERYGMSLADLRAIALALGYAGDMLVPEMFVGNQRDSFLKKVQRAADGDIYLTGAMYLIYEGQADAMEWMERIDQRQYEKTEELIFALSLYPRFDDAFLRFKPQLLSLLGKQRTIPVLGNTRILDWLIPHLQLVLKGNRAKDLLLFRALCALPTSYVKEGSRYHTVLLEHGYTNLEIVYANMMTIQLHSAYGSLNYHSIVTEKVVIALFQTVFTCEDALPEEVYPQLSSLFSQYETFKIKCYGCEKLIVAISGNVRIKNPKTLIWFNKHAPIWNDLFSGFDVLDPHWDVLATEMEYKAYLELFECSLRTMDAEAMKQRIARFDQLTGTQYLDNYCEAHRGRLFSQLVEKGIIDLWQAFLTSLDSEGNISKPVMVNRIESYLTNVETIQAFHFYELFLPKYGFDGLKRYFADTQGLINSFFERNRYGTPSSATLKLRRDYLDDEKRLRLLTWLEEYIFSQEPAYYLSFVIAILKQGDISALLGQQTRRQLFDLVIEQQELVHGLVPALKEIYMTQEELLADRDARTAERLERERQAHLALVQSLQEYYHEKTDGSFSSILSYMDGYRYSSEERPIVGNIVHKQFPQLLEEHDHQVSREDSAAFLLVCAKLVKWGITDYPDVQKQISLTNIKEAA